MKSKLMPGKIRRLIFITGFIMIAITAFAASAIMSPLLIGDEIPFHVGEYMEHSIRVPALFGARVATMYTHLYGMTNIRGHYCYKVHSSIHSTSFVESAMNFQLHNHIYEYFDSRTFEEISIVTIVTEGTKTDCIEIEVYPEFKKFYYQDQNTNLSGTYKYAMSGMLSLIYGSRVLRLSNGDVLDGALLNGSQVDYIHANVTRGEEVYVPAFNKNMGIIKIERTRLPVNICLSQTAQRIPVFMISTPIEVTAIGAVVLHMKLEDYRAE